MDYPSSHRVENCQPSANRSPGVLIFFAHRSSENWFLCFLAELCIWTLQAKILSLTISQIFALHSTLVMLTFDVSSSYIDRKQKIPGSEQKNSDGSQLIHLSSGHVEKVSNEICST